MMITRNFSLISGWCERRKTQSIQLAIAGAFALLAAPSASFADTYPSKPIRIIVPFTPGGGSDSVARLLGNKLGQLLGQSVVVENKPGAGGLMATSFVAAAPADGYTLFLADASFAANISVYSQPKYQLKDFAPVSLVGSVPFVAIVGNHIQAKTIKDLVALAKSSPHPLNMASGGTGGVSHLQAERFARLTGVSWTHVPYRGVAPALLDVAGGQADLSFPTVAAALPFIKSGKVQALAVTSSQRSVLAPDIPTFAELGYSSFTSDNWYGLVAPAKVDPAILAKLHDQIQAVLRDPDLKAQLLAQSVVPSPPTSQKDFSSLLEKETQIWAKTVKESGISAN